MFAARPIARENFRGGMCKGMSDVSIAGSEAVFQVIDIASTYGDSVFAVSVPVAGEVGVAGAPVGEGRIGDAGPECVCDVDAAGTCHGDGVFAVPVPITGENGVAGAPVDESGRWRGEGCGIASDDAVFSRAGGVCPIGCSRPDESWRQSRGFRPIGVHRHTRTVARW